MANKFYEALKSLFYKPQDKKKYLVQVTEVCPYLHEESPQWQVVESDNKIKRGMHHSYDCGGSGEKENDPICEKCGYRRTRKIISVEVYTFKRAKELNPARGTKTLKDLL